MEKPAVDERERGTPPAKNRPPTRPGRVRRCHRDRHFIDRLRRRVLVGEARGEGGQEGRRRRLPASRSEAAV